MFWVRAWGGLEGVRFRIEVWKDWIFREVGIILVITREGKEVVGIGADGFICLDKGVFDIFCSLK